MSDRYHKKPHLLQFGNPHDVHSRQGLIQGDISINFHKYIKPWFNFGSLLTSKRNVGDEKLGSVFPTLVQVSQCDFIKKDKRTKRTKDKQGKKIVYVDLHKLDKSTNLNKDDKKRLKFILNELKCDNIEKLTCNRSSRRKHKSSVINKLNKPLQKDKNAIKLKKSRSDMNNKFKSTKSRSKTMSNNYLECKECKRCSKILNKNENEPRRKQRIPTTITLSEHRIFQTLIELDPRSRGDTMETLSDSSGVINSILNENNKINIKNIELKYLNPTYVVQYNSTEDNNTQPRQYRERYLSNAAMDAHLGHRPSLAVQGMHDHEKAINFLPSDHRIGQTEEMKEDERVSEERKAGYDRKLDQTSNAIPRPNNLKLEKKADKGHIAFNDPAIVIGSSPPKIGAGKWPQESLPSYALVTEQPKIEHVRNDPKKKKYSTCKALTQCLRKCLGLSDRKKPKESTIPGPVTITCVETPMTKMDKEEYLQSKKFSSNVVAEVPPAPTITVNKNDNEKSKPKKGKTKNIKNKRLVKFKSMLETNELT